MRQRAWKPLLDWLVYLAVRVTVCIVQALPLRGCYRFAAWLAWLAYHADGRHREVAFDNLRRAFPGHYSEQELQRLVRAVYRHFAAVIFEIAHIPRLLRAANWQDFIVLSNPQLMLPRLLDGGPVILLTAHFGNWEMAGYVLGAFGFKPHSVARTLDNPYLERLVRAFRTHTGQQIIYKRGAFDQVSAAMEQGALVGFLSDQDAGRHGVFVDFFGRPASSHKGVALLALEHDAPIFVGFARRLYPALHSAGLPSPATTTPRPKGAAAARPLRHSPKPSLTPRRRHWQSPFLYQVWIEEVVEPHQHRQTADPIWSITQACARAMERAVRQCPEQYLWLHRRWKHQPPASKRQVA